MLKPIWIERGYPFLVGLGCALLWYKLCGGAADSQRDLLGTLVSLSSIVVGFLATAMSIVVSAPDSSLIRELRTSGYSNDLIWYLKEPFSVGIVLVAVSILGYFLSTQELKSAVYVGALVGLTAWLLASLTRIGFVFMAFMRASAFRRKSRAELGATGTKSAVAE